MHIVDGELREAVASRNGASAFRVEAVDGETREMPLPARLLA